MGHQLISIRTEWNKKLFTYFWYNQNLDVLPYGLSLAMKFVHLELSFWTVVYLTLVHLHRMNLIPNMILAVLLIQMLMPHVVYCANLNFLAFFDSYKTKYWRKLLNVTMEESWCEIEMNMNMKILTHYLVNVLIVDLTVGCHCHDRDDNYSINWNHSIYLNRLVFHYAMVLNLRHALTFPLTIIKE